MESFFSFCQQRSLQRQTHHRVRVLLLSLERKAIRVCKEITNCHPLFFIKQTLCSSFAELAAFSNRLLITQFTQTDSNHIFILILSLSCHAFSFSSRSADTIHDRTKITEQKDKFRYTSTYTLGDVYPHSKELVVKDQNFSLEYVSSENKKDKLLCH